MLKNALFFGKIWKNCRSVEGSAPKPRWPPAVGATPPDSQVFILNFYT